MQHGMLSQQYFKSLLASVLYDNLRMNIDCKYSVGLPSGWTAEGLREAIVGARNIALVAHKHADGDAVGSLTGMYALLRHIQRSTPDNHISTITPLLPDGCPDDLTWMPNTQDIVDCAREEQRANDAVAAADLVIALDLNGLDRTGRMADTLKAANARKILIDHHIDPQREQFDIVVSDEGISSACEMVFWAMRTAFGQQAFDLDSATSLYAGICTDTGTFSYSNTRQSIYLAAAELLTYGIDPMAINRNIKNVFTTRRLKFFGHAMSQLLTVYEEKELALMVLTKADIERYGVDSSELTGLVNEVMKLRDIDCAVLVREEQDEVRLSFRSKVHIDVNCVARELFDGGGHERAAGATSHLSLEETVAIVKCKFGVK